MRIIYSNNETEYEFFREMTKRAGEINLSVNSAVLDIINDVRENGDEAIRQMGMKFDGACPAEFEVAEEKR